MSGPYLKAFTSMDKDTAIGGVENLAIFAAYCLLLSHSGIQPISTQRHVSCRDNQAFAKLVLLKSLTPTLDKNQSRPRSLNSVNSTDPELPVQRTEHSDK
jgi:hypothetical protein